MFTNWTLSWGPHIVWIYDDVDLGWFGIYDDILQGEFLGESSLHIQT